MKKSLLCVCIALTVLAVIVACDGNATSELFISPEYQDCLCFTASRNSFTFKLVREGSPDNIDLVYSKNGRKWMEYSVGDEIRVPSKGRVYLRATDSNSSFSKSISDYYHFIFSGTFSAGGSITYLLDSTGKKNSVPDYAFVKLFSNCTELKESPQMPAKELGASCYREIFSGCSNLNSINVGFESWGNEQQTEDWVNGVPESGFFECSSLLAKTTGSDFIPERWSRKTVLPMFWLNGNAMDGTYCVLHQDANLFISYRIAKMKVSDPDSSLFGQTVNVLKELDRTVPDPEGKSEIEVESGLFFNAVDSTYNGNMVNSNPVSFIDSADNFFVFTGGTVDYSCNCSCTYNGKVFYILSEII